ncbi:MAG: type IV pilus biogenesis/stability protein PilW [Pseudomonadota bacterium]
MRPERAPGPLAALLLAVALAGCGATPARRDPPATRDADGREQAVQTNVRLGQGYLSQGKLELARDKLLRALELDPRSVPAHTVVAILYERIGDRERARVHYRRSVELAPAAGDAQNNYATFLCQEGNYEEADRRFGLALDDPFYRTPAVALSNRGACALSAGRAEAAEESLRRAVQLAPDMPDALYGLARATFARGDFLRARAFVQRYEATGASGAEGLLLGYQIERSLGNMPGANDYRQRLLAQFPDSEAARRLEGEGVPQ